MRDHDIHTDLLISALSHLPMRDIDDVRARRLRHRCRAVLSRQAAPVPARTDRVHSKWCHAVSATLVALWSTLFLAATLRQAAAIFGM
jgi:hypothetical protein